MQLNYKTPVIYAALALVAGCGHMGPPPLTPPTPPVRVEAPIPSPPPAVTIELPPIDSTVVWWLDYYSGLSDQPQNVLVKEYKSAERVLSAERSLKNRLRLIALLSLRDTSFHNPEQAVKLLDGLLSEAEHPPPLRNAASIMRNNLLSEIEDTKKIQALSGQVREMQNSTKEMQNQLNALKEIERSLSERNKPEATIKR